MLVLLFVLFRVREGHRLGATEVLRPVAARLSGAHLRPELLQDVPVVAARVEPAVVGAFGSAGSAVDVLADRGALVALDLRPEVR